MSGNGEQNKTMLMGNEQKTARMEAPDQSKTMLMGNDPKTARMDIGGQATAVMSTDHPAKSQNDSFIPVGEMIAGRFRIIEILTYNTGEATLYICDHEGEPYVAKVFHGNMRPKDEVTEKIRSIHSKYVIPTLEHGVHERTNRYYEIMPYYSKGDLAGQVKPFSADVILDVIAPSVNEGLNAIHQAQVVHRDIKPNNIFLSDDSRYVILGDFGISSFLEHGTVANTGNSNRTDGYAAPELYSHLICKENDYYSFGIMLLELALGEHPFKGFTSEQIMKVTIMDTIAIANHIPQQLSQMIKGLTRKDRKNRWGYDEVRRWLNGEDVNVAEEANTRNIRPYRFDNQDFYTLEDLALSFAKNWNEAKKHLYRGLTRDFVKQFGEEHMLRVIECEEMRDQDQGLFQLLMGMHQNPPLCWKGQIFNGLEELGEAMNEKLPKTDSIYMELLQKGILLNYITHTGAEASAPEFYAEVAVITDQAHDDGLMAYYRLAFTLSGNSEFQYNGETFSNVDALIDFLCERQNELDQNASRLLEEPYFFAWLIQLGYESHLEKWRSVIN